MPELHDCFNNPLSLSVSLGILDLRESLFDLVITAQSQKGMVTMISSILLSIVGIVSFYCIGTFFQNLFQKRLGRILGLVREYCGIQLTGEIIYGYKQVFSSPESRFPLKQRKPLCIPMQHLAWVIFVVTPGLAL
jgi:uncharacterized membrane protein YuzA (DUF378 family)